MKRQETGNRRPRSMQLDVTESTSKIIHGLPGGIRVDPKFSELNHFWLGAHALQGNGALPSAKEGRHHNEGDAEAIHSVNEE
jgi:hypothetical protein